MFARAECIRIHDRIPAREVVAKNKVQHDDEEEDEEAQDLQEHAQREVYVAVLSLAYQSSGVVYGDLNDNGEGGTFALYSLLCRHAKLSLLSNQQQADEDLSTYKVRRYMLDKDSGIKESRLASILSFSENNYTVKVVLLVLVLLGTCMVIGDGGVTPSISVFSAVSGINGRYAR
ncbi:hypothetical protein L7F22_069305 [Adiantum nelumboides]|nr:hypothetical protein [Adiantum nelumboides]